jgi:hypothetical protein
LIVIAGLDPAIHRSLKDGCPGQARPGMMIFLIGEL